MLSKLLKYLVPKIITKIVCRKLSSRKQCPPHPPIHKEGGYKIYKYMSLFVGLPAIVVVAAMTFIHKQTTCEERLPFAQYEYLRRRTKRFPWGDGSKSLFHNPAINALPEGYEVESECGGDGGDGGDEQVEAEAGGDSA